jgi:iron complex outermembrane receptor protein
LLLGGTENLSVLERLEDLDILKTTEHSTLQVYTQMNLQNRFYDNETDNYQQDHYNCDEKNYPLIGIQI